jgi:hypothetical protein
MPSSVRSGIVAWLATSYDAPCDRHGRATLPQPATNQSITITIKKKARQKNLSETPGPKGLAIKIQSGNRL